ncbi:MAG TPA: OB-fold nucleic acid binding domain-containing protein, partial [Chloroflexota bacterium]|nr:OB-fold nucleic acid binding domain-containing protein [Chloroflexota bacterium]
RALWEKEVLGFQFGDHPYLEASLWLAAQVTHDTSHLTADLSGERVKFGALVTNVRRITTKTKSQMAMLMLEDLHGTIEAVVFPRVYEKSLDLWREDAILLIDGKVDTRGDKPQVVVDRAEEWTAPPAGTPLPAPRPQRVAAPPPAEAVPALTPAKEMVVVTTNGGPPRRVLEVVVPRGEDDNACVRLLEQLHVIVERSPGQDHLQLVLHDRAGGRIELSGADILVHHTPDLESQVRTLVGKDNVLVH